MSKDRLKKLARGIVLAQGNHYIKVLLRDNGVRIGTTKANFLGNLIEAIDSGALTAEHFDAWLEETEGWGNQHVYLFEVPDSVARDGRWTDAGKVEGYIAKAGLGKFWNAPASYAFPKARALTGIYCDGKSVRLLWHQGIQMWIREEEKDFQQPEGDELYEYRAHREQPKRSVMRFEWPLEGRIAAAFLQIPWDEDEHDKALAEIWAVLGRLPGMKTPFTRIALDLKIRALDKAGGGIGAPTVQSTRLRAGGAYVDFVSTIPDEGFTRVDAVARVHRAVEHGRFHGDRGLVVFRSDGLALTRDVKIQMYGDHDRTRFWAQCSKQDVWAVLQRIIAAK